MPNSEEQESVILSFLFSFVSRSSRRKNDTMWTPKRAAKKSGGRGITRSDFLRRSVFASKRWSFFLVKYLESKEQEGEYYALLLFACCRHDLMPLDDLIVLSLP